MKKILFLALIISIVLVNAQGRRKDQYFIYGEAGYLPQEGELKVGYMAKAGYGKIFGNNGFLGKAEAFYQDHNVIYIDSQILPYQKYGLNINAGYSYEGLYPLMLNLWGGAYGAYENVNKGNKEALLKKEKIQEDVKRFTYGISGSAEAEVFLIRGLSLLMNYSQFYDLKSKFLKSNYAFLGGLRFYIN